MPNGLPKLGLNMRVAGTPSKTARVVMGLSTGNFLITYNMATWLYKKFFGAAKVGIICEQSVNNK